MAPGTYDDDLRLAHVLADSVERTALELFASPDLEVSVTAEGTLTTQATARLEELLRHQLQRTRPRDRVEGRVLDPTGHGDRRWVLDAIDGTANYVRGVPVWATLISLVVEDDPVLGLVAAPTLARRWWAGRGSGAWTGRQLSRAREVRVGDTSVLEHASVSVDEVASWLFGPLGEGFARLSDRVWRTRAYGDFWSHALVAEGAADVALAAAMDTYQLSALSALVQEAGGWVTDPWGGELRGLERGRTTPVVVTNGVLHDHVLETLTPAGPDGSRQAGDRGADAVPSADPTPTSTSVRPVTPRR